MGTERGQINRRKQKDEYTKNVLKPGTCIIVPGTTTAVCSKESTAPHDTAPQNEGYGTTPHCVALRC